MFLLIGKNNLISNQMSCLPIFFSAFLTQDYCEANAFLACIMEEAQCSIIVYFFLFWLFCHTPAEHNHLLSSNFAFAAYFLWQLSGQKRDHFSKMWKKKNEAQVSFFSYLICHRFQISPKYYKELHQAWGEDILQRSPSLRCPRV